MKEKPKYKMIQVSEETHTMLKQYCQHHGFKISGLLTALVRQYVTKTKR
jgi:hypothetical protein